MLIDGGRKPPRSAATHATASSTPAAAIRCPVIDLVELTGGASSPASRHTDPIARDSVLSLSGVAVPCALT